MALRSGQADELSVSKVFPRAPRGRGVDRPDLFAASQIRIRLWLPRDIGIPWRVWGGDNPFAVQRNAGHKRFSTTEKYIGDPALQPTGTVDESGASPEGVEPSLAT